MNKKKKPRILKLRCKSNKCVANMRKCIPGHIHHKPIAMGEYPKWASKQIIKKNIWLTVLLLLLLFFLSQSVYIHWENWNLLCIIISKTGYIDSSPSANRFFFVFFFFLWEREKCWAMKWMYPCTACEILRRINYKRRREIENMEKEHRLERNDGNWEWTSPRESGQVQLLRQIIA